MPSPEAPRWPRREAPAIPIGVHEAYTAAQERQELARRLTAAGDNDPSSLSWFQRLVRWIKLEVPYG